jgi:hypothetical protein
LPPWLTASTQIQSSRQSANADELTITAITAAVSQVVFIDAIRCPYQLAGMSAG